MVKIEFTPSLTFLTAKFFPLKRVLKNLRNPERVGARRPVSIVTFKYDCANEAEGIRLLGLSLFLCCSVFLCDRIFHRISLKHGFFAKNSLCASMRAARPEGKRV